MDRPGRVSNESQKLKNEVLERMLQYKEAQVHALEFQKQVRLQSAALARYVGSGRMCVVCCNGQLAGRAASHCAPPARLRPGLRPPRPATSLRAPSPPQMDPPPRFTVSADMVEMMRREGIAGLFTPEVLLRRVGSSVSRAGTGLGLIVCM